jgi:methionyl-tRNA formyltransferase
MSAIVVASSRPWFWKIPKSARFRALDVHEVRNKEDLSLEELERISPRYVFFPHWNWIVAPEIFNRFECVVFHTAPLPFGRGGSPIQNLILADFDRAPVCAIRMTEDLDGGPVYDAIDVSLAGTISEILERIGLAIEELVLRIVEAHPTPVEQVGEPFYFKRLRPEDSELPSSASLEQIYDRIRMVDGEGYPRAFVRWGDKRIEFSDAELSGDALSARVRITREE